ncbi:hypothetical protein AYR66_25475 [Noviherbaspirillum denitrificans]|uniref:Uncharacterized protein n=1 Tax=Noviherbaspirillum denitrificans TaxID=1968433 RepID=A0A254TI79_9BURK|nr:hypothetical protein AYR66_25475 [Noviherbaspirillum denitrificans]
MLKGALRKNLLDSHTVVGLSTAPLAAQCAGQERAARWVTRAPPCSRLNKNGDWTRSDAQINVASALSPLVLVEYFAHFAAYTLEQRIKIIFLILHISE